MPRKKVVRGEGTTRLSILAIAAKRFAAASYDDVSLRDLAADAGVDVAYVHRSFGSKESLFREVLDEQRGEVGYSNIRLDALPMYLARRMVERPLARHQQHPDPLLILIRSLLSTTAGSIVGERMLTSVIEPLRQKIGDSTQSRALMIMSLLIGFTVLRNLLQLPVDENDRAQIEVLITSAIEGIMTGNGSDDPMG